MYYNKQLAADNISLWCASLERFHLPSWEELPGIGLYMDQMIALVAQYLDLIPPKQTGDAIVTASAVNNYVRIKLMPAPYKKKYFRPHLAYLIMICTLKQSLSIADVMKLLPPALPEERIRAFYGDYIAKHRTATLYFVEQLRRAAAPLSDPDDTADFAVSGLVFSTVAVSGLSKLVSEQLIALPTQAQTGAADI